MVQSWGSEQFLRYQAFYEVKGVGHAWVRHWVTSLSVLLNAYIHMKHEYIWLRDGGRNGF